jgi:uncharacterized protein (TIGR02147 family)
MQETSEKIISVFNYTDYRKYLADYYSFQKKSNPAFSYRFFARRAQISSSGFYKEVMDGKRSLSRSLIHRFSAAIKHNKKEADYFENMVYFTEAASIEERVLYFKKMMASYESKAYRLLGDQYEYFSRWYYVIIRELLACIRFKNDYQALARMVNPPIRPDQAKKAIRILEKLKLIEKDREGFYVRCSPVVTTGYPSEDERVHLMNVINFQKAMLRMADQAYDRHPLKKIDMSTLTLSVSEETYLAMKDEIASFRKRLLSMAEKEESPDRIYQLYYSFFPMTKASPWKS